MDQIEEVKQKTDIVQLISENVELKRAGRNFKGLCPFHLEKTPSFMVTPELQIFKCFGCGLGGDALRYIMEFEKVDFPQALKLLADRAGVKLRPAKGFAGYEDKEEVYRVNFLANQFYHYILTQHKVGEKARLYLARRGIQKDAVEMFSLGYSPDQQTTLFDYLTKKRGYSPQIAEKAGLVTRRQDGYFDRFRARVIFPLKDHLGNILSFAGRVIEEKGETAKYINGPETLVYKKARTLYGLDIARQEIKSAGRAIVAEGEIDCISCWQAGIKNIVAIKGSALTEDQAQLLSRFCSEVILALDSDFAGNQAARRGLEIMKGYGFTIKVAGLGVYKDPDEMARKDPEGLKNALDNTQEVHDFLINSVFSHHDLLTTEGKAKISREIVPILASIDDEIIRAHCVRTVAQRLEVPEDAVRAEIAKKGKNASVSTGTKIDSEDSATGKKTTRRDVLEEHLAMLAFGFNTSLFLEERVYGKLQTPIIRRLADELRNFCSQKEKFNTAAFSERLPDELKEVYANLVLSIPEREDPEFIKKEIASTQRDLELLGIKEEISRLTREIHKLEQEGRVEEVRVTEEKLTEVSAKLVQIEASAL